MSFKRFRKNQKIYPPDLSKVDESISFKIDPSFDGKRLDVFISDYVTWFSRVKIQKMIKNGDILKNGQLTSPAKKVRTGDTITIKYQPPDEKDLKVLELGKLDYIYEDEFFTVINKPANLVVHPVGGRRFSSVINIAHKKYRRLEEPEKDIIPIIAHRIDIETSGALLIVKDKKLRSQFVQLFEDRNISKKYLAICEGNLPCDEVFVDLPIGARPEHEIRIAQGINFEKGQPAQTIFHVHKRLNGFDVVECELLTGRHHQIRVHIEALGHPLVCDPFYGKRINITYDEIKQLKKLKNPDATQLNPETVSFFNNLPKIRRNGQEIPHITAIPPGVIFQNKLLTFKENPADRIHINPFEPKSNDDNIIISRTSLHSWKLKFIHPATQENIEITAPLPADFKKFVTAFE